MQGVTDMVEDMVEDASIHLWFAADRRRSPLPSLPKEVGAVNHRVLLTRECESSKAENAGCGRNPDGCTRRPKHQFPKRRMAERRQKLPTPCKDVRCASLP